MPALRLIAVAAAAVLPVATGDPAPRAIPLEQVFRAADDLDAQLEKAETAARGDPAVDEVERQVAASEQTVRALQSDLSPQELTDASTREIERMRLVVSGEDALLASAQGTLEKRAEALALHARELQERVEVWKLTGAAATEQRAPAAVLRRIEHCEQRLRAQDAQLRSRRDRLLALQGRTSEARAQLSRLASSVAEAEAALQRQLFEVESAPLWDAMVPPDRAGALGTQLRQALRESARDISGFVASHRPLLSIHLVLIVALALGLIWLRRPAAAIAAQGASLHQASQVLSRPWSAAVLVSLLLAGKLCAPLPPTVNDLFFLAGLLPLLRILRGIVPEPLRRPLYAFAALFALDKLASLAPPATLLARLANLVVSVGAASAILRNLRGGGWRSGHVAGWRFAIRASAIAALALMILASLSNVVGNATLAERVTHATLLSATLAATLAGAEVVLESTVAALLHLPALQRRHLVAAHRELLQRRCASLLRLLFLAIWAMRTAKEFGIGGVVRGALAAVLGLRLQVGGLDVSLGNVVAFAVTLAVAVALSRAVRFLLDEGVFAEVDLPRGVAAATSRTVQYALVLLGCAWAILASGVEMSRFSFIVGALGVGIGFGLQNVVNNFVSGLILLYERPVQVRDVVEVGSVTGEVTRIGIRSSTVRTFAGAEVIVPNATLISTEVTNWTLSDRRRRIELTVGAAYGTSPELVIELLLATVRGRAGVLESPAPVALFLRFGESSIDFALRFWTADFDRWQLLASEVLTEISASFGRAGIQIPFPQRDLHLRSIDAGAAKAFAADGGEVALERAAGR